MVTLSSMKLKAFIEKRGVSAPVAANQIGVTKQSFYRYLNGRFPERKVLERIFTWSNGQVTANDFLEPIAAE